LPHDLPRYSAVDYYFALWRDDGTDQVIHDLLRCQVREKAGRTEDPSAVALDCPAPGLIETSKPGRRSNDAGTEEVPR
jgi:hypothetical protein